MRPAKTQKVVTKNRRRSKSDDSAAGTWRIDKRISSDPQEGIVVIRELLGQLENQQWPEGEIFGIHLSLEEAIANAIHHGNARDREKSIRITLETSADLFYAKITDEGGGFDPQAIPDPTSVENLERPCGRGLMLMRCYMDSVAYSPSGNSVELHKKRSPEHPRVNGVPGIPE